jgi:hypothetical protein
MSPIRREIQAILAGAAALGAAAVASAENLPLTSGIAYYISGSTAMDNAVKALLLQSTGGICKATPDVYIDSTAADITKAHNTLVVCALAQTLGGTATSGTVVAFDKESNGGSLEGILPISESVGLKFFTGLGSATSGSLGCTASQTVTANCNISSNPYSFTQAYTLHYGCTAPSTSSTAVPVVGLADENAESFNFGNPSVTGSDSGGITTTQLVQNVFGIGVSLNLYRALQRSQGYTPVGTAADDSLANMPTLTSNVIRSLYNGAISTWGGLTNSAGTSLISAALAVHPPTTSIVYICRRGDSSGTNTSVDIKFGLNPRCTGSNGGGNSSVMLTSSTSVAHCKGYIGTFGSVTGIVVNEYGCSWVTSSNSADTIFAGFGGGDVQSCLTYRDCANQFAIGNLTTNAAMSDVGGAGGTGDASTSTTGRYRFVAIDGKSPDLGSVVNGTYDFVQDNILVTTNKSLATDTAALVTYLQTTYLTNAALVKDFMVTQPTDTNFTAGVLVDPVNSATTFVQNTVPPYVTGAAVKSATSGVSPVSPFTFLAVNGTNPQGCAPPFLSTNTGTPTSP